MDCRRLATVPFSARGFLVYRVGAVVVDFGVRRLLVVVSIYSNWCTPTVATTDDAVHRTVASLC